MGPRGPGSTSGARPQSVAGTARAQGQLWSRPQPPLPAARAHPGDHPPQDPVHRTPVPAGRVGAPPFTGGETDHIISRWQGWGLSAADAELCPHVHTCVLAHACALMRAHARTGTHTCWRRSCTYQCTHMRAGTCACAGACTYAGMCACVPACAGTCMDACGRARMRVLACASIVRPSSPSFPRLFQKTPTPAPPGRPAGRASSPRRRGRPWAAHLGQGSSRSVTRMPRAWPRWRSRRSLRTRGPRLDGRRLCRSGRADPGVWSAEAAPRGQGYGGRVAFSAVKALVLASTRLVC